MADSEPTIIRPLTRSDHAQWRTLWDGYNAFYGRSGATALPEEITASTWGRFFDPAEPVHALVAEYLPFVILLAAQVASFVPLARAGRYQPRQS